MAITQKTTKQGKHVCGFCSTGGRHDLCPGGTLNGNQVEVYVCPCTCDTPKLRCLDCNAREDTNPETWTCNDVEACASKRAARRAEYENTTAGRLTTEKPQEKPKKAPVKPKTGTCLCCGETTGGGLFRPGHDSKYLTRFVTRIKEDPNPEGALAAALAAWTEQGISPALQAKLQKRVA